MRTLIVFGTLLFSLSTLAQESTSTSVLRLPNEPSKSQQTSAIPARYVLSTAQSLRVSCPSGHKILSASCEAQTPRAFGFDNLSHNVFTKTEIQSDENRATCRALNLRPDEIVRLVESVRCSDSADLLTAQN